MSSEQSPYLNSFARRRGRKLRIGQSALMETLLPKLLIVLPDSSSPSTSYQGEGRSGGQPVASAQQETPTLILPLIEGGGNTKLWFEIGFGAGEHLVEQARRHPEVNFIGCEPFINGMARLLAGIDKDKLENIRLYDGDARLVLERLADNSLERLFILFPDPWPKVRHHKRRIVSQEGLELFYRKLKPGGLLRLATDHEDYGAWMLEQLLTFNKFRWLAKQSADWKTPPDDWVQTRYQSKAAAEGRSPLFLNWIKPF